MTKCTESMTEFITPLEIWIQFYLTPLTASIISHTCISDSSTTFFPFKQVQESLPILKKWFPWTLPLVFPPVFATPSNTPAAAVSSSWALNVGASQERLFTFFPLPSYSFYGWSSHPCLLYPFIYQLISRTHFWCSFELVSQKQTSGQEFGQK